MKPVTHSPCVNQCQLDNDSVCKGCGRTLHEIDTWPTLDSIDKENVFKIANERLFRKLSKI